MLIQWFPGHMTKTKRMIEDHLKAVDVVAELLDARIPASSANPMVEELVKGKPRIVILNKADLADPKKTDQWISYYKKRNIPVVPMTVGNGKNKKKLMTLIRETAKPILDKWYKRGLKNRSVRLMILGIPNVGKSSLINFIAGTAAEGQPIRPVIHGASSGCGCLRDWIFWIHLGYFGLNLMTRRRPCVWLPRVPLQGTCLILMKWCRCFCLLWRKRSRRY